MSLFTPFFTDKISVREYLGAGAFGDAEYAAETDMCCRIEYKTQETLDSKGDKVISTAEVYSDLPVPPLSIATVNGARYTVKSCSPIAGLMGEIDHYEIIL